ncbi:MAG: hypothetical protein QGH59_10320 [Gemmatimonadota bacterium]|nr:hypothetical protein [Gemmatimonadota bacterium]
MTTTSTITTRDDGRNPTEYAIHLGPDCSVEVVDLRPEGCENFCIESDRWKVFLSPSQAATIRDALNELALVKEENDD